jgi:hypothetical protein
MKLSNEQIKILYEFTRQHYVEYYDLQTELVDHLANSIEQQWEINQNLSFENALQIEFKKFGIFGFSKIVEQRQKVLNKKYNTIVWKLFKEFFNPQKSVLLATSFFLFYKLLSITDYQRFIVYGIVSVLMVVIFIKTYLAHQKLKAKFLETKKKWLFEEVILRYGSFPVFLQIPLQLIIHIGGESEAQSLTFYTILFFSIITFSLFILGYILLYSIPSKANHYLKETYPEYELSH